MVDIQPLWLERSHEEGSMGYNEAIEWLDEAPIWGIFPSLIPMVIVFNLMMVF